MNGQESINCNTSFIRIIPRICVGPLLFLIYINDWANGSLSGGCLVFLYADDLLLYKIISCPDDYTALQLDINSVSNWINQHHLSLNVKCMTVTRLRQNSSSPPVLQLNGEPMENVTSCKYLGVTLTSNLMHLVRPHYWERKEAHWHSI